MLTNVGATACVMDLVSVLVRVFVRDFSSCDGSNLFRAVGTCGVVNGKRWQEISQLSR